jgi:hypothetical protein
MFEFVVHGKALTCGAEKIEFFLLFAGNGYETNLGQNTCQQIYVCKLLAPAIESCELLSAMTIFDADPATANSAVPSARINIRMQALNLSPLF